MLGWSWNKKRLRRSTYNIMNVLLGSYFIMITKFTYLMLHTLTI